MMKKAVTQRCVETENSASEVMTYFRVNEYISATPSPWIDARFPLPKCHGRHFNPSATAEEVFEDTHTHTHTHIHTHTHTHIHTHTYTHTHTHTHTVSLSLSGEAFSGFVYMVNVWNLAQIFRRSPFLQTSFSDLMKLIDDLRISVRELKHLALRLCRLIRLIFQFF